MSTASSKCIQVPLNLRDNERKAGKLSEKARASLCTRQPDGREPCQFCISVQTTIQSKSYIFRATFLTDLPCKSAKGCNQMRQQSLAGFNLEIDQQIW